MLGDVTMRVLGVRTPDAADGAVRARRGECPPTPGRRQARTGRRQRTLSRAGCVKGDLTHRSTRGKLPPASVLVVAGET